MDEKKIAFIMCVNDLAQYNKAREYIYDLYAPVGFQIEIVRVLDPVNIFSGYNEGMKNTDAKYKVYMHQDVYIRNQNFIGDILRIFGLDPKIGLIGVVGAKKLPSSGIWWEAEERFGEVYDSQTSGTGLLKFQQPANDYEIVEAVDGLIMATQYDCTWREDIFKGWHLYDASQCLEMARKGYNVAVPKQEETWCIHDSGAANIEDYNRSRLIFLNEYND